MKIRHLLVVAAAAAAVADVSAFEWNPSIQQPNLNIDVTQAYQLETMRIAADIGLATTDIMPKYVDENDNEIIGSVNAFTDPGWGEYVYDFKLADFKANGEYKIVFPEGMLKNSAGELSDPKEFYCTVEVPELAAAMFDDFEVTSVFPDFSEPQGLWEDQLVKINTNHNDAIGFTKLFVTDNTTGESVTISSNFTVGRKLGDNSEISWTVGGLFKFYEEHQYTAEFVFFNGLDEYSEDGFPTPVVARKSYEFTGKVEGYKYSDLTLLSIDPAPLTLTISDPSQAVFTYTFSGPVTVYKAETPMGQFGTTVYPESCLSSNEDKTVWTLDLSDNDYVKSVDAELVIYIYARDLEGYQLRGNFGEEGNACYVGQWICDLGAKSIVVVTPYNGETLDALTEIVVKSENGEPMSYNWGEMTIQNLLGEVLGTLVYDGEGGAETEYHFTKWMVGDSWDAVPLNIVAEGSYVINFPTGCFVFGEEFSSVNSRSLYSGFQITGVLDDPVGPGVDPAEQEVFNYSSVSPEEAATVKSLDTILLRFPEQVACEEFDVMVYSAARAEVTTGTGMYDWGDPNLIVITLAEPVTVEGKYEVVIPSRVIGNDEFFMSDGKSGICNPEIRLHYTVDPEGNTPGVDPAEQEVFNFTKVAPAEGSVLESLSLIQIWFPDVPACAMFDAYLYKADAVGEESGIAGTASVLFDWEDDLLVNCTFAQPVTEKGDYVFVIPARMIGDDPFIYSDGAEGICNPEIRLSYTIDPAGVSVDAISEAACADVYDVQGRLVLRNASAADIKKLDKGIYVAGGKKFVVR